MKFLQTGDWHLGKVFYETSLIEDQKHFLSEITDELARAQNDGSPYDALVVPGDVYDRAVPPAEAVSLLSGFLASAHEQFPLLHILLLSGRICSNSKHDTPTSPPTTTTGGDNQ